MTDSDNLGIQRHHGLLGLGSLWTSRAIYSRQRPSGRGIFPWLKDRIRKWILLQWVEFQVVTEHLGTHLHRAKILKRWSIKSVFGHRCSKGQPRRNAGTTEGWYKDLSPKWKEGGGACRETGKTVRARSVAWKQRGRTFQGWLSVSCTEEG